MEVVSGDNWSYKTCEAPVKSSPPTNQHPTFYRPDELQQTQLYKRRRRGGGHMLFSAGGGQNLNLRRWCRQNRSGTIFDRPGSLTDSDVCV